jgi:S-adenosylmethionine uptake transporter
MQSLWMIFAALCFSVANLTIKLSTDCTNPGQVLFFRGGLALLCIVIWSFFRRQTLRTAYPKLHLSRSLSGVGAVGIYTYVLTILPMVTTVTLNYTAPVWLATFTVVFAVIKRTKVPPLAMLMCIAVSMVGVVLLLKPAFSTGQGAVASLGLLSGFLSAIAYWQIKSLNATGEPIMRIVFYHSLTMTIAGLLWWLIDPRVLELRALPWLFATAIFTLGGQLAMTFAVSKGKALFTSSLMYLTVVFSAILGVLLTHDGLTIDWLGYVGAGLIIACSIAATALNLRKPKTIL